MESSVFYKSHVIKFKSNLVTHFYFFVFSRTDRINMAAITVFSSRLTFHDLRNCCIRVSKGEELSFWWQILVKVHSKICLLDYLVAKKEITIVKQN